jgi:PKD repeat protein
MKKTLFISFVLLTIACTKNRRTGEACIEADALTVSVGQDVNVSNCGSEFPSNYVSAEIDWGDGTMSDGQTGSHAYSDAGTYVIRLFLNGESAEEAVEAESEKVNISITVTE